MRLTVLGRSPACPNPGGACSGYLVEEGDTCLLLDCGTGVVSHLREIYDYRKASAIVITHMHFDHFIDIIPYAYGLKLISGLVDGHRPQLLLPPGGKQILEAVISNWPDLPKTIAQVFRVSEYNPDAAFTVGSLEVTFSPTVHSVPAWSQRLVGSKTLVYSADSGPSERLVEHARDADLLLIEAALLKKHGAPGEEMHLTPREAGEIARQANVRRLVLTHFWQEFDQAQMRREASAAFAGPAELAEEWKTYVL